MTLWGPMECPNCGHDPTGDDEEFTSGGGWVADNSINGDTWTDMLRCPTCNEVVARDEREIGKQRQ